MIGRSSPRARHTLAVSVLTAGIFLAGLLTRSNAAVAAQLADRSAQAATVTIAMHAGSRKVTSLAEDVGGLLEEQGIHLGARDQVVPGLAQHLIPGEIVRIVRVANWTRTRETPIAEQAVHQVNFDLPPGSSRILSPGHRGLREAMIRFTQYDNGRIEKNVLASRVTQKPAPRIIADGVDEYAAFLRLERNGLQKMAGTAAAAMQMVATAYTAGCPGCSGTTALGYRAGHGIVAVDPSVIPLGTRLYIPGYGRAIAGDTGGAIHGYRIDLGFNSVSDALRFGRREITVFRLH